MGKYSLAYIGKGCGKNTTRIIGIDSAHPGHFQDTTHYHYCNHRKSISDEITITQVFNIFVNFVTKYIMKKHNQTISLTLEAQGLVDEIPEFGNFIKELSSHLSEWDKALERNREYYRRNPNAPPITEDTPPLDSDE